MRSKQVTARLGFSLLLFCLLAGCQLTWNSSASIRVGFPAGASSRTLGPDNTSFSVDHWSLSGLGPGASFSYESIPPGTSFVVPGIAAGTWSLTAQAFDPFGGVLMTAEGSVEAVAGQSAQAELFLHYAAGQGNLALSLTLGGVTGLTFSALVDPGKPEAFTVNLVNGVASSVALPAGFHSVQFQVLQGSKVWWGSREAVLVLDGRISTASKVLSSSPFSERLVVSSATSSSGLPFDLTVSAATGGGNVTLSSAYSGTSSLAVEGPVAYQWYCDGEPIAGAEAAFYTTAADALPRTYSVVAAGLRAMASASVLVMPPTAGATFVTFPQNLLLDTSNRLSTDPGYDYTSARGRFLKVVKNADPTYPGYVLAGNSSDYERGFTTILDLNGVPYAGYAGGAQIRTLASRGFDWGNSYFAFAFGLVQQPSPPYAITTNEYIQNGVGNTSYYQYSSDGNTLLNSVGFPNVVPAGTMAITSSGQIYVSEWSSYMLHRKNADLSLDSGFNSAYPGSDRPSYLTVDASDQLVVAGENGIVARLDTSGALDPSFSGGTVTLTILGENLNAMGVKVDPSSGKIYVVGTTSTTAHLVRLNTDGTIDTAFNGTGWIDIGYPTVFDLDVDAAGNIVVVGDTSAGETSTTRAYVRRYSDTAVLDPSLDVVCSEGAFGNAARSVVVNGSNVIVVGLVKLDAVSNSSFTLPAFWKF